MGRLMERRSYLLGHPPLSLLLAPAAEALAVLPVAKEVEAGRAASQVDCYTIAVQSIGEAETSKKQKNELRLISET
mgnify:FL=1